MTCSNISCPPSSWFYDKAHSLICIAAAPVWGIGNLALGLITAPATIITMADRDCSCFMDFSANCFIEFGQSIQLTHLLILHLLNTEVELLTHSSGDFKISDNALTDTFLKDARDYVLGKAEKSRLCYFVFILVAIVTRVFEAVIGSVCAILSILALGRSAKLNQWAISNLAVGMVVYDCFYGLLKTINPWAKLNYMTLELS